MICDLKNLNDCGRLSSGYKAIQSLAVFLTVNINISDIINIFTVLNSSVSNFLYLCSLCWWGISSDECKSDVKNPSTLVVNCPIFYDRINQEKLTLGINLKSTIVSHLCIIHNSSWQALIKPLSPRLCHRLNEEKAVSSLFFLVHCVPYPLWP